MGDDPRLQTSPSAVAMGLGRSGMLRSRTRCWDCWVQVRCHRPSEHTCPSSWMSLEPSPHLDSSGLPLSLDFPRSQWDSGHGKARVGVGGRAALGCPTALTVTWLSHQPLTPIPPPPALRQDARGTGLVQGRVPAGGHPSIRAPCPLFPEGVGGRMGNGRGQWARAGRAWGRPRVLQSGFSPRRDHKWGREGGV